MRKPIILVSLLAACGSDAASVPDASMTEVPIDGPPTNCLVNASYGNLGTKTGTKGTAAGGAITGKITLDDSVTGRDILQIKLTPNMGVFTGPPTVGTFQITGAETSLTTCGACVNIIADVVPMMGGTKFYQATSGTVTLTSVDPVNGSLSDVQLVEWDVAGNVAVTNGCVSQLDAISFTTL